jgi:hypothetical protein
MGWGACALITGLNLWLVSQTLSEAASGPALVLMGLLALAFIGLLAWVAWVPFRGTAASSRQALGGACDEAS